MERDMVVRRASSGQWYIYSYRGSGSCKWLSKVADEWLGSSGSTEDTWDGYYKSERAAKVRLERYKRGVSPTSAIHIGGE